MQIRLKKLDKFVEVDFDALPQASKDYIIKYGLTQTLNDAMAGATNQEAEALFQKRLDYILSGDVGKRVSHVHLSTFESECQKIAVAILRKKGFTRKNTKPEDYEATLVKLMAHEKVRAQAQMIIDADIDIEM